MDTGIERLVSFFLFLRIVQIYSWAYCARLRYDANRISLPLKNHPFRSFLSSLPAFVYQATNVIHFATTRTRTHERNSPVPLSRPCDTDIVESTYFSLSTGSFFTLHRLFLFSLFFLFFISFLFFSYTHRRFSPSCVGKTSRR